MQPPGRRSQGGVSHHWSVPGVCVAADGAVPLCLRVQWEVPHHHSQPHLLLPVWQLHWQQPAGEDGAGVRFKAAATITFFSFSQPRHLVWEETDDWAEVTPSGLWHHWVCSSWSSSMVEKLLRCLLSAIWQRATEDSLSVELPVDQPCRLHQPTVQAQPQPDSGATAAVYCPLLL